MLFSINNLFITYPEFRPYFYSGKDIQESDPNYGRAISIAEAILDVFDIILIQKDHLPKVWDTPWWDNYVADSFANSPILCRHLELLDTWYTNDIKEKMRIGIERKNATRKSGAKGSLASSNSGKV